MIIVIGRPGRPLTKTSGHFFSNVTVTFKHWNASYSPKHMHGLNFDIKHRTFRIAASGERDSWYIVMHPISGVVIEFAASYQERKRQSVKSSRSSALLSSNAQSLATYIKDIFSGGGLSEEGIESSWTLGGLASQNITSAKWDLFQDQFMECWEQFVLLHSHEPFWQENRPAFHTYDYGANIEFEVNEYLQTLPKEPSYRPPDEESDAGHEDGLPDEGPTDFGFSTPDFPPGLATLRENLEQKYVIDNIGTVSYALAVDIHNEQSSGAASESGPVYRCMLANRNRVRDEFPFSRDFTFFPLAFHPAYGNFSSHRPPRFLNDHVLTIMKDNLSYRNQGADPLSYGAFQAYSNIKRAVRHGPEKLLANKGIATAALTLPETEARGVKGVFEKRLRLQKLLRGDSTPNDPQASKPFARECRLLENAIHAEALAERMEQNIHLHVSSLIPTQRNFTTVLQPIIQLMRFFLQEPEHYTHLLWSFPP
jgi:hypothetical protein